MMSPSTSTQVSKNVMTWGVKRTSKEKYHIKNRAICININKMALPRSIYIIKGIKELWKSILLTLAF